MNKRLNFAANLSFLFPDREFPDRFQVAAKAGFRACEYLFPYDYTPQDIAGFLQAAGLKQALRALVGGGDAAP